MPKTKKSPTMDDLLSQSHLPTQALRRGDVVEGRVVVVSPTDALIDVGAKSEGILPFSEFKDKNLKVDGKVLVYVLTPEDKKGQIRLSLKKAQAAKSWLDLQKALTAGAVLKGKVNGHNKGGLTVDIMGQNGFVPFSHLIEPPNLSLPRPELQSILDHMRGETLQLVCLEVDPAKDRVILSERLAHEAKQTALKQKALKKFKPDQVLEAEVKSILPYGVEMEMGDVSGLVEVDEIAWKDAEDVLRKMEVGKKLKVKILSIDQATAKVRLSIKQTQPDPWQKQAKKMEAGSSFEGEVIKISSLGIVVRNKDGLEGLLPLSKLSQDNKDVKIGERMKAIVDGIDREKRELKLRL